MIITKELVHSMKRGQGAIYPRARHVNAQPTSSSRRRQHREHDPTFRKSDLTFAVVWDPENGAMESFSGDSLGKLTNYRDDDTLPDCPPPVPPKPWETIPATATRTLEATTNGGDPASREVSLLFSDSDSIISTNETIFTDSSDSDSIRHHTAPTNFAGRTAGPLTPGSEFTFAALWDPKTGFSTLRNGKLVAVSSTPPRPENRPSQLLFDDLDFLHDDGWDGRSPPSHFASVNSSKDVEQDDIPNIRGSDPEPFEDYPLQLAALCGAPDLDPSVSFSNSKYTSSSEEDEGFFDSYNHHEDCEPHLPSRFSSTTIYTSTSRYLNADLNSVSTPGAHSLLFPSLPQPEQHVLQPRFPPQDPGNMCKIISQRPRHTRPRLLSQSSFKLHAPVPRLSQVFKARWSKRRSRINSEKWVMIDVQRVS